MAFWTRAISAIRAISVRGAGPVLLALAALVSACVPFPNVHYYAPVVTGVVLQDGKPAAGVTVRLSARGSGEMHEAVTDHSGRFAVPAIHELSYFLVLVGDPLFDFSVTLRSDGREYEGYRALGLGATPKDFGLECDLARPIMSRNVQSYCRFYPVAPG